MQKINFKKKGIAYRRKTNIKDLPKPGTFEPFLADQQSWNQVINY